MVIKKMETMMFNVVFLLVLNMVVGQEVLRNYKKFVNQIKDNLNNSEITSHCKSQFIELFNNDRDDLWNFFDANSKFPWSGLATSTKVDLGNYDQCININDKTSSIKILGKYCYSGIKLNNTYFLALCLPSGCSASDYKSIFNLNIFNDDICHTMEYFTTYTGGEITMIVVLALFAIIILVSTIYDVYLLKKKKKSPHPIYIAFSAFTNGRKILKTSKGNKQQIQVFNGVKTTSLMLVTAFHVIFDWQHMGAIDNYVLQTWFDHLKSFYINCAYLAVDSFFFMSGFLVAYSYMKQKRTPLILQIKNAPILILHRYIRLTPSVGMLYFFFITLFKHISSGPVIKLMENQMIESCRENWLPFFLYIQNYYNDDNICLPHTWFLSVNMQLFVISPIILIPLAILLREENYDTKQVIIVLFCLNIFSLAVPIGAQLLFYIPYDPYHATHLRLIDHTMGITLGIFISEAKDMPFLNNVTKKSIVNLIIWAISLCIMTACALIYIVITNNITEKSTSEACHTLLKPFWCLGLSWMVYSSYHGYGGIINWILTRPTFEITAKLSYSVYLVHLLVIFQFTCSVRTRLWFDEYTVFINWCGMFIVSYVAGIIWSLCFEYPINIIEGLLFGTSRKPKVITRENVEVPNGINLTAKEEERYFKI